MSDNIVNPNSPLRDSESRRRNADIDEEHLKDILTASYQPQREAETTLSKKGYKYDYELSSMESKVFVDPKTGKPSIAYRGSTRASDFLYEDPALLLGYKTEKQKKAEKLAKDVEIKYGQPVDVYGHSLGGYRAEKSGASGKITTYNKGAGIFDIGKKIPKTQTDIRKEGDVVSLVSLTQRGGKKETQKNKIKSANIVTQLLQSHKFT
jgi:hypothetical protein